MTLGVKFTQGFTSKITLLLVHFSAVLSPIMHEANFFGLSKCASVKKVTILYSVAKLDCDKGAKIIILVTTNDST